MKWNNEHKKPHHKYTHVACWDCGHFEQSCLEILPDDGLDGDYIVGSCIDSHEEIDYDFAKPNCWCSEFIPR